MASSGTVEHLGIISEISRNLIRVSIVQESACGHCKAKGSCSISDSSEKTIDITSPQPDSYRVGEEIRVILEQSLGIKALGLGYILPFFVLLFILVTLVSLGINEGLAGILSIVSLAPYYLVLWYFRDNLKREFSFTLKKL
ncbi:MAG: SoxR reducing system RseC family protein [Bacteroidales bacterium]